MTKWIDKVVNRTKNREKQKWERDQYSKGGREKKIVYLNVKNGSSEGDIGKYISGEEGKIVT